MVLLSPKFVFVAILASLTAVSLAPTADAAAIAMRRSHQQHISDSSEIWSGSSQGHLNHPVLPLPARLTSASGKQTSSRGGMKRQSPRDFFASQRRALTPENLPPLLTRRDPSHEHAPPPERVAQQSTEGGSGSGPYVHVKGVNSHVAFGRRTPFPDPHHRHNHNHHGNHHDHHHGSKHSDDVVVIKGDNDNVHIGRRSPLPDSRHDHHDHHRHHHDRRGLGGNDMNAVREDNDLGRRSPEPRHDHHHHHHHHGHGHHEGHGGEKVIIKGDDNNVSVHSRSRTPGHQQFDHSPEYPENTSYRGHQRRVHARKYIPRHQPHRDGEMSTDHIEHSKSSHRAEKHPRSVLINSVEGEEKYLVPDDYQDQRVTAIEGDGISKVLPKVKRGDTGVEGVPGSIEIMSQSAMSEAGQRIASLVLVQPDSTMASEFGNNTFILNASESNHTQLYMVALNVTDPAGVQGEDIPVALKVPVFNPDSASIEGYCATYDPQPPAPAPLSAEPCFYDEPAGPHKSQVFSYTPSTSVIRPMWFSSETDEEGSLSDAGSNSTVKPDAAVDPKTPLSGDMTRTTDVGVFGNSTAPPPSMASLDNSTGIDQGLSGTGSGNDSMVPNADDFAAKAQNVTLIFSPATPIIPAGSRMPTEDLGDETPMSETNSTNTDTSASPLTSSAFGRFNDTESGTLDDAGLSPTSTLLPYSAPSGTPEGDDGKDLNVMVGVAREKVGAAQDSSDLRAVNTAPYKWRFDRERS